MKVMSPSGRAETRRGTSVRKCPGHETTSSPAGTSVAVSMDGYIRERSIPALSGHHKWFPGKGGNSIQPRPSSTAIAWSMEVARALAENLRSHMTENSFLPTSAPFADAVVIATEDGTPMQPRSLRCQTTSKQ